MNSENCDGTSRFKIKVRTDAAKSMYMNSDILTVLRFHGESKVFVKCRDFTER